MMWCYIYRSPKKENSYIYMENENNFSKVPDNILAIFGTPIFVMRVLLDGKRNFVVGSSDEIETKIKTEGFFLQMLNDDDFKI